MLNLQKSNVNSKFKMFKNWIIYLSLLLKLMALIYLSGYNIHNS